MKKIHLLGNAHLDPVWLWRWDEGAAEALSTFRIAADFCERYDAYIFNHNEVVLYQWVETYDYALFQRIQKLVKEGKWHIMGGWYLQPDCNMPTGEALIRQITVGRSYFMDKFSAYPQTAINFDPFGSSRGLVQVMKKSGYNSYIFGRPFQEACELEKDDFVWVGFDGSEILANRAFEHYLTLKGQAANKIDHWINERDEDLGLVLWGIGNHGGGPSKIDLDNITEKIASSVHKIIHSTPEAYFEELEMQRSTLPRVEKSLNYCCVGCFTSQVRIKQTYRELENEFLLTEKMATMAYMNGLIDYPSNELNEAQEDMLFSQFHDILPGTAIKAAEDDALRRMAHGLEILSRLKTKIFLLLSKNQERGDEDNLPILVYNPHPYEVTQVLACEFQLANQNWGNDVTIPTLHNESGVIPSQLEKEASNLSLDWRKNIVFKPTLKPMSVNRFYCNFHRVTKVERPQLISRDNQYVFRNDAIAIRFDCRSGLISSIIKDEFEFIKNDIKFNVLADNEDTWSMNVKRFDDIIGEFKLASDHESQLFCGDKSQLTKSFRLIEEGSIRTVIEGVYVYNDSFLIVKYKLPNQGCEIELDFTVYWNEVNKLIKLAIPTAFTKGVYEGQVVFGSEKLRDDGDEVVSQKWCGLFSKEENKALTVSNIGSYGSDCRDNTISLTLLRSCAYSAHPIPDRPYVPYDRHLQRVDQGERSFKFWLNFGDERERRLHINRESKIINQKPYPLSFYPSGGPVKVLAHLAVSNPIVELSAFKKAEKSDDLIIRLFNPIDEILTTDISISPISKRVKTLTINPFEIVTLSYNRDSDAYAMVDLIENE